MIDQRRREYPIRIRLNGRLIGRVLIDPHYEARHSGAIRDSVILELVRMLDRLELPVEAQTRSGFEIFRIDPLVLDGKCYRLILTLPPLNGDFDTDFVGVVNAFRVQARRRGG